LPFEGVVQEHDLREEKSCCGNKSPVLVLDLAVHASCGLYHGSPGLEQGR
jgi:hypothetical protein